MAINLDTAEGIALKRLAEALHNRRVGRVGAKKYDRGARAASLQMRPGLDMLAAYYEGDPPLDRVHQDWEPYQRQVLRMGRYNIANLLVSSTRNRMSLRGFRTASADDEIGDVEARKIIRFNGLASKSRDVHSKLLAMGDAYTIVTPPSTSRGEAIARITDEDPRECITDDHPMTGRPRRGLKLFRDDWDAADWAYLFLPDGSVRVARNESSRSILNNGMFRFDAKQWEWDDSLDQPATGDGRLPIFHFRNTDGVGEFEQHLDSLDRLNDKIFNEWWVSKVQAFRQRAVKNLPDSEVKIVDGKEVEVEADYTDLFTTAPDAMWQVPEGVDFWESQPIDLTPIIASVQKDLERLAAATSQPLHTITPDAANGSAEGASLMREEHLYKILDRLDRVDPEWAHVMGTCFLYQQDDVRADVTAIEPLWAPIERFSLQQRASAASQLRGIMPLEAIWRDVMQYDPAEIPNLRTLQGRDFMGTPVAGGPAVPAAPAAPALPAAS